MKVRLGRLSFLGLSIALVVVVAFCNVALAQSTEFAPSALISGVVLLFFLSFGLGFYIYISLALQTIATKTGTANAWLAWIPIANLILMLNVARKPWWWFFLFLIPLVNLVIVVLVWMGIAEARRQPNWWGILMIVPMANLVVPGYLAWVN